MCGSIHVFVCFWLGHFPSVCVVTDVEGYKGRSIHTNDTCDDTASSTATSAECIHTSGGGDRESADTDDGDGPRCDANENEQSVCRRRFRVDITDDTKKNKSIKTCGRRRASDGRE